MTESQIQNLFIKIEKKLEATFTHLHNYSPEEKQRAFKEIQESSWLIQKIGPTLFNKVVKDLDEKIKLAQKESEELIKNAQSYELTSDGLKLNYPTNSKKCPLATLNQIREHFQDKKYFLGYYIQLSYLIRPENHFPLSIYIGLKENKICDTP